LFHKINEEKQPLIIFIASLIFLNIHEYFTALIFVICACSIYGATYPKILFWNTWSKRIEMELE